MGALLTIDPTGTPTAQVLTAGLHSPAYQHLEAWQRQSCDVESAGRVSVHAVQPIRRGQLELRLTDAEVATFRTDILPGLLAGEVLRVAPDVTASGTYGECVLDALEWVERYGSILGTPSDWFTLEIPVAYEADGWL